MNTFHNIPTSPTSKIHGETEDQELSDETLDVKDEQDLPISTGFESETSGLVDFDSQDDGNNNSLFESSLPPYDPVTNYLSPRPKYLLYNPDRRRKILARGQEFARILETASCEDETASLDDESEPSVENVDGNVEESVDIDEDEEEGEGEEEEFDEIGDENRLKVFLQYVVVMVALILITLTISSMNSPPVSPTEFIYSYNVSETEGEAFCPMMIVARHLNDREIDKGYKKRDLFDSTVVSNKELVDMQQEQTEDDAVADLETVESVKNNETDFDKHDIDSYEEAYKQWQEAVILISKQMETYRVEDENKVHNQLLGAGDPHSVYANDESEMLKPMVDEDDSNVIKLSLNESYIEGKENTSNLTILRYLKAFDSVFIPMTILLFVCASVRVLYCSMQTPICSPISQEVMHEMIKHVQEVIEENSSIGSFCSDSLFSEYHNSSQDANSSTHPRIFDFQQSTCDSPSHGSFTIQKKIIKKQRSKTPETVISSVRRSSRIHSRSISSP